MKLQYVREPSVTRSKRYRGDLPRGTSYDDDLLLQDNRQVTNSIPVFPSQELKYYDTYNNLQNINALRIGAALSDMKLFPAVGGLISTPSRGTSANQRIGKRILLKNWRLTGTITMVEQGVKLSPPSAQLVFVALVLDTQVQSPYMTDASVFWADPSELDQQFPPFREMLSSSRYQVLKSDVFKLGPVPFTIDSTSVPAEYSWAGDICCFDWFVPADFLIEFNGTNTATTSAVQDRGLYLLACQSGGEQLTLSWKARIRFYDASLVE